MRTCREMTAEEKAIISEAVETINSYRDALKGDFFPQSIYVAKQFIEVYDEFDREGVLTRLPEKFCETMEMLQATECEEF